MRHTYHTCQLELGVIVAFPKPMRVIELEKDEKASAYFGSTYHLGLKAEDGTEHYLLAGAERLWDLLPDEDFRPIKGRH